MINMNNASIALQTVVAVLLIAAFCKLVSKNEWLWASMGALGFCFIFASLVWHVLKKTGVIKQ